MKLVLSLCLLFFVNSLLIAQSIEIYLDGEETDISGTVINIDVTDTPEPWDEYVINAFRFKTWSDAFDFKIERIKVVGAGSVDYLYAGTDEFEGSMYAPEYVTDLDPFITYDAYSTATDSTGYFRTFYLVNDFIAGCGHYRYFVLNESNERLDSIDINICSLLSIEETEQKQQFSIYPNPTNGQFTVLFGSNDVLVEVFVYNLQGELVMRQLIKNGSLIDLKHVSAGIYLVGLKEESMEFIHFQKLTIN